MLINIVQYENEYIDTYIIVVKKIRAHFELSKY